MSLFRRVRALLFQRKAEREMETEIQFHLQRETEKNIAAGMSPDAARRKARVDFGGLESVREEHREARGLPLLEELWADARYALRSFRRNPAFAFGCIATLGVGIGVGSAVFTVGDAVLLRPLPYPRADRLVSAWMPGATGAAAEYVAVRDRVSAFQSVGAYDEAGVNLGGAGAAVRARAAVVTPDLFTTLGVPASLGRTLSAGAASPGAPPEAVLSDQLWRSRFGGRADVLDSSVLVDGAMRRIVGVMPASFHFPSVGTDLWIPALINPADLGGYWGWWHLRVVARLKDGATAAEARDQTRSMAVGLRREHAVWDPGPAYGQHADAVSLQAQMGRASRTMLMLLASVAGVLLLIACANVANLMLVRTAGRDAEIRTRTALGAGRGRLARLLMVESLLLAVASGLAAAAGAKIGLLGLRAVMPESLTRIAPYRVDGRVIGFTIAVALAAGLAVAMLPVWRLRTSARGIRNDTRDVKRRRVAELVTVTQVALAVGLVGAAGLLLRSLSSLSQVEPGFSTTGVLSSRVTLAWAKYSVPGSGVRALEQMVDGARGLPGVDVAAGVSDPPLRGPVFGMALRIGGQFEDVHHSLPTVDHRQQITPDYFSAMRIPILKGRAFTTADRAGAPWVAVISASMARKFWPGQDPIGQRIGYPYESPWITVVGVAGDVQQDSLNGTKETTLYLPLNQSPFSITDLTIVLHTAGDPLSLSAPLKAVVNEVDPDAPVSDVHTTGQLVSGSFGGTRFVAVLLAVCATLATVLGAVGVYGVLSSLVAERTREIGIRVALGATPGSVAAMVLGRAARLAAAGVACGAVIGLGTAGGLRTVLFGVTPHDPASFLAASAVIVTVTMLASWLPTRRALRHDPVTALRSE